MYTYLNGTIFIEAHVYGKTLDYNHSYVRQVAVFQVLVSETGSLYRIQQWRDERCIVYIHPVSGEKTRRMCK